MLKRYVPCFLALIASLAISSSVVVFSQDSDADAALPADLSLDGLALEAPQVPDELIVIDPALLTPPENATVDELFEFIESLQDKLPEPKSQADLYKLVDAFSQTCLKVADLLFAMEDLTSEQVERATQLKVVALTTRVHVDEDAAGQLNDFVEENLKKAKTDEELIKAYQLKLQVLAASSEDSQAQIDALIDETLALEQEELQMFAVEVKGRSFITEVQKSGKFNEEILTFCENIINDKNRSTKVKEKAYEMKLVALVVANEVEQSQDESESKGAYAKAVDALFLEILDGDFSLDLKKVAYQLRVQSLFGQGEPDEQSIQKLNDIVERLADEEDEELHSLQVSVKAQLLTIAAQKDINAVSALSDYADEIAKEAGENEQLRMRAIGMKITAFRLQNDTEGLVKYIDEQLTQGVADELKTSLQRVKLTVVSELVVKNPESFDSFKDFCLEVKKVEELADSVDQVFAARFVGETSSIAEKGGTLDDFSASLERFKNDLIVAPHSVTALLMAQQAINTIGAKNNDPTLFDKTFESVVVFCKGADSEELNELAQQLDMYLAQMRKAAEEAEAAAKAKAEADAKVEESKDVPEDTDTKPVQSTKKDVQKSETKEAKAPVATTTEKKNTSKASASVNQKKDATKSKAPVKKTNK